MLLLDLKISTSKEGGNQNISFEFYRKPMAARQLMLARSAMPDRIKRASLTQEAVRILRNCSEDIPWERRAEHLSDLCLRMKMSGYSERYRQTVIQSALKAWERMLEADRTGARPLYRDSKWLKEHRAEEGRKKTTWYKGLGGQISDFPVFCPMSPGEILPGRDVTPNLRGHLDQPIALVTWLPDEQPL
jgi:hypothetical protein